MRTITVAFTGAGDVTLTAKENGTFLTGDYVVGTGENTGDLTVSSVDDKQSCI